MTDINKKRIILKGRLSALLDDYFMDGFNGMAMRADFIAILEGEPSSSPEKKKEESEKKC